MSLDSAGVSMTITDSRNRKLGYGYDKTNDKEAAARALRLAVEEFIKTDEFKQLTTTSCYGEQVVNINFLLHTTMPR